jgi:2'-deoxynucleoside 5'-phosphate N-hydrolase
MNIYFAGSVRGGRAMQPWYAQMVRGLEQYGTLISAHTAEEDLTRAGETDLRNIEIWSRERERVALADVVVADVTQASLGVGYLVAYASSLGKRTIALVHGTNAHNLSAMIAGDKNVEVHTYATEAALANVLEGIFLNS